MNREWERILLQNKLMASIETLRRCASNASFEGKTEALLRAQIGALQIATSSCVQCATLLEQVAPSNSDIQKTGVLLLSVLSEMVTLVMSLQDREKILTYISPHSPNFLLLNDCFDFVDEAADNLMDSIIQEFDLE